MIRVLRIIEYQFDNYEDMERHFEKLGVPLNGKVRHGNIKIRSASIDTFEEDSARGDEEE